MVETNSLRVDFSLAQTLLNAPPMVASRPLRTLHIETGRRWVGGPVQVLYLLRGLQQRGHHATLVCAADGAIRARAEAEGLRVLPIPITADTDPRLFLALWAAIRAERPDLVHLHSRRGADTLGGLAARLARVPAVVLSRRVDDPVPSFPLHRLKFSMGCDRIVAISEGIQRVLLGAGIPDAKVVRVRSATDTERFQLAPDRAWLHERLGLRDDVPVAGTLAQLITRKGHRTLLAAVPAILQRFPRTVFAFFGEGREEQPLRDEVRARGLERSVIFAGFEPDVPRVLAALDLVIHPAHLEGLGIAVLEAMAAARPVVASAVGGIPEAICSRETGLLVPPDDPDALASAVIEILTDPRTAAAMGRRAAEFVRREFDVDAMVDGNLQVYRSLVDRR